MSTQKALARHGAGRRNLAFPHLLSSAQPVAHYIRIYGGNQQVFGTVEDEEGRDLAWDRDAWRVDAAGAYRFNRHLPRKLRYGSFRRHGNPQRGEQLVAAQLTLEL